jgi:hypothetical protein
MNDNSLLFYSELGYVLFDQKGAVLDSNSVFKKNKGLTKNDSSALRLAFPVDQATILYYNEIPLENFPCTLFRKKLYKAILKPVHEKPWYAAYAIPGKRYVSNFAFNAITDNMVERYYLEANLIGYTSITAGDKWWSVEKFYSLASPLVHESDGRFLDLFPGMDLGNLKINAPEPLQIFNRDNCWHYSGIAANVGLKQERYYQTFFIADQAGNILCTDTLLRRENLDKIIGEDKSTYYTVKGMKRNVFNPAVAANGNLFYAIYDYPEKRIEVRTRTYYTYAPFPAAPLLKDLVENEKFVEYVPLDLECSKKTNRSPAIPEITVFDLKKKKYVRGTRQHLTIHGYLCQVSRNQDRELKKKLDKSKNSAPKRVQKMIDSLSHEPSTTCPYTLLLSGPTGTITTFKYLPGDDIVCARVLALLDKNTILVRVDCRGYAEALLFKTNGAFLNRFVFNRQNYENRLDILVASEQGRIVEMDFESEDNSERWFEWKRIVRR